MKINKLLIALLAGAALVVSCAQDEIDGALDKIASIEDRVTALEAKVEALNSQVLAAQDAVEALEAKKFITNVQQVDGGVTITLEGGKVFFVSNGKDGAKGDTGAAGKDGENGKDGNDGTTPVVSIIEVEGVLVWAVNGEALIHEGNTVPVYQGEATVTPYFKIEGEKLYVKYGASGEWELIGEVGKNTVDAVFSDVKIGEETVVFTLADGTTTFEVPMAKAFKLNIEAKAEVKSGLNEIPYTVAYATATTTVDAFATGKYLAEVDAEKSVVKVTAPTPYEGGQILVWAESGTGLTSIKKVSFSEAPYAEVADVDEIVAEGGEIEVPVVSNVEIDVVDETEDWLSYKETKVNNYTVVLIAEANTTYEPRSASVNIVRKSDKKLIQTITVAQKPTWAVTLNGTKYQTIQAALTAAEALEEGTASITLGYTTFEEAVKIDGSKIKVPVIIDGGEPKAKIVGGIEIYKNAATIKNLDITVATTSLSSLGGTYLNDAGAGYAFGIQINEPGHGVTIQDNVINNSVTNATAIYVAANAEKNVEGDLIKGNVLNCGTQRGMQVYGSIKLIDNTITSSKYPVRLGMTYGMKTVISGNSFVADKETATAIDVLANLNDADITLGDGTTDDNLYNANFTNRANRTGGENVVWHPAIANPYPNSGDVTLNGAVFGSIQAAVNAAANLTSGTANIVLKESATFTEEVKISGNEGDKDLSGNTLPKITVPVVIDGQVPATTVVGSFEISRVPVTIKNMTINSTINSMMSLNHTYGNSYTTAVLFSVGGYESLLENLTINCRPDDAGESYTKASDGTAVWVGSNDEGKSGLVTVKNCTFTQPRRCFQLYGCNVALLNNTINASYSSYAIRAGNNGIKLVMQNNTFNGIAKAVNFYKVANGKINLTVDGVKDSNNLNGAVYTTTAADAGALMSAEANNVVIPAFDSEMNYLAEDALLTRVWARWDAFDNTWDDEILPQATGNNWARNGVIVGEYLYIPIAQAAIANSGIAVFKVLTGEYVTTIKSGLEDLGHFKVCGIAKLGDAVYVSSMGMNKWGGKPHLVLYKLTTLSGGYYTAAQKLYSEELTDESRYGDVMTAYGDETNGLIFLVDYFPGNKDLRKNKIFVVTNGVLSDAPHSMAYLATSTTRNEMIGIHPFAGDALPKGELYALVGAASADCDFRGLVKYDDNANGWWNVQVAEGKYATYGTGGLEIFDHNVQYPMSIFIGGKQYLMYVNAYNQLSSLRLVSLDGLEGAGLLTKLYNLADPATVAARTIAYPLAAPGKLDAKGPIGTNSTGFLCTTEIGGVTYIVACGTEVGISCFKVN